MANNAVAISVVTPDIDEVEGLPGTNSRIFTPARRRPLSASVCQLSPQRDPMLDDTERLSKTLTNGARRPRSTTGTRRPDSAASSHSQPEFESPERKVPLLLMSSRPGSRLGASTRMRPHSAGPRLDEDEEGTPRSEGPELALHTLTGGPKAEFFQKRHGRQHYIGVSEAAQEYNDIIGMLLEEKTIGGGQRARATGRVRDGDLTLLAALRRKQEQAVFDSTYQASMSLIATIKGGGTAAAAEPRDEPVTTSKPVRSTSVDIPRPAYRKVAERSSQPVPVAKENNGKSILARIEKKVEEYRGDHLKRQELQHRVNWYSAERKKQFTKSYITDNIKNAARWNSMHQEAEVSQRAKHEQNIEEARLRREIIDKLKYAKVLEQAALFKM